MYWCLRVTKNSAGTIARGQVAVLTQDTYMMGHHLWQMAVLFLLGLIFGQNTRPDFFSYGTSTATKRSVHYSRNQFTCVQTKKFKKHFLSIIILFLILFKSNRLVRSTLLSSVLSHAINAKSCSKICLSEIANSKSCAQSIEIINKEVVPKWCRVTSLGKIL